MAAGRDRLVARRDVLVNAGAAVGAIALGIVPRIATALPLPAREAAPRLVDRDAPAQIEPELHAYFGPLQPGARVGRWQLVTVHAMTHGVVPVVLADEDGQRFQVDVCRRDRDPGAPRAVGNSDACSVFLSNCGRGSTPSVEAHGLGAMALADALRAREADGAEVPAGLRTLRQRLASCGSTRVLA